MQNISGDVSNTQTVNNSSETLCPESEQEKKEIHHDIHHIQKISQQKIFPDQHQNAHNPSKRSPQKEAEADDTNHNHNNENVIQSLQFADQVKESGKEEDQPQKKSSILLLEEEELKKSNPQVEVKKCSECMLKRTKISSLETTVSALRDELRNMIQENSKIRKSDLEKSEEIKSLRKFISQTQKTVQALSDEIDRKNKIIKEKIELISNLTHDNNARSKNKKASVEDQMKQKLEGIKSKLLKDNYKPLKKKLNITQKELKNKEKEIRVLKMEVEKLENQVDYGKFDNNNNDGTEENKKENKNILGNIMLPFFRSKSGENSINSVSMKEFNSLAPTSDFLVSQQNKLGDLIKEKEKLQEKVSELNKIKEIFTDRKMINFFYGNSEKDVEVRSYIGFAIKQSPVSESSENEINFFSQVFKNDLDYYKRERGLKSIKIQKNKKLFSNGLKKEEINRIVKCYGFWKKNIKTCGDSYCIALERGRCDLKSFLLPNRSNNDPDKSTINFQKIESFIQNTEEWTLNLMREICLGVKVLHQHSIAHNDIKPENILVCEDFKNSSFSIKMMDFESVEKIPCIFTGTLKGTPNYICPNTTELKKGIEDRFSLERDIFSLGVVLVFILFKKNVFDDFLEVLRKKVSNIFAVINLPYLLCKGIKNWEERQEFNVFKKMIEKDDEQVKEMWNRIKKCRIKKNYFYLFRDLEKKDHFIFDNEDFVDLKKEIISCFSFKENERSDIFKLIKVIDSSLSKLKNMKKKEKLEMKKKKKALKEKNKQWKKEEIKDYSKLGIFQKEVKKWKNREVIQWLADIDILEEEDFQYFIDDEGKDLLKMEEKDLLKKGMESIVIRKKLLRELYYLREFGYGYNVTRVLKKMIKHMKHNENTTFQNKNIFTIANCLSNEEKLMESYFKVGSQWDEIFETNNEYNNEIDENDPSKLNDNEIGKFPIKLVVTELHLNQAQKNFRRVFSPIFSKLKFSQEFGIFHSAIIIGPWYLEWLKNSLVIPRKISSSMAVISADIDENVLTKGLSLLDIKKIISKVIIKWNSTMNYCNININNKPNLGNCQDFVEDVMVSLKVTLNREGAFGHFLEKMKKEGKCKLFFNPTKEFIQVFQLGEIKHILFDSHSDLDLFVEQCQRIDEIALLYDFREEYRLLKSFDRAFWLRHLKNPSIIKFQPSNCPFLDPRKTKSFMYYY